MKRFSSLMVAVWLASAGAAFGQEQSGPVVVTASNGAANQLLVYDKAGRLLQTVPTAGQGGVAHNAGGVAAARGLVAVVNFGSQNVSTFVRGDDGFVLRDLVPVASPPVSVALAEDHLYVLGTTTVESHRLNGGVVDPIADGIASLVAADASAAQVGIAGDRLVVTEKSGVVETVTLRNGAVANDAAALSLPTEVLATPFGFVTRGATAYITVAGSDLVALIKNGRLDAVAATGVPGGTGEQAPCWIAVSGPYLFTSNTPSHSLSRLVAAGNTLVLDRAVAAHTAGAPGDIAASAELVAVIESDGGGTAHLTQFRVTTDGELVPTATTAIASPANGVAIVFGR